MQYLRGFNINSSLDRETNCGIRPSMQKHNKLSFYNTKEIADVNRFLGASFSI